MSPVFLETQTMHAGFCNSHRPFDLYTEFAARCVHQGGL